MLDIVASYHCMQLQGKLMIQTQNGKKLHFGHNLSPLGPNCATIFFFSKIWFHQSLDIMVSYHHVKKSEKPTIQSREDLVTDRRTDRRTDESDFIGRCLTDVERQDQVQTLTSLIFYRKIITLCKQWSCIFRYRINNRSRIFSPVFKTETIFSKKL